MPATIIVGAQWGDEGKAKVLDALMPDMDIVVRYQGGSNAGHTVVVGTERYAFHLVPSGILHDRKVCVIANGCVVEPVELMKEIDALRARGVRIDGSNLLLSERAHLVMPYHRLTDQMSEKRKESSGEGKIGTTGRGIGPCYVDKVARSGLRAIDLLRPDYFLLRVTQRLAELNPLLTAVYGVEPLDPKKVADEVLAFAPRLKPFIADTAAYLNGALAQGKALLLEGAQGSLLDIDHGTYPFVTSSNATSGGATTGTGISPRKITLAVGVAKAYVTRVGSGPFPTELTEKVGEGLRQRGVEFGTTTGRPRRCGWFDAVGIRYAVEVSGIDAIALTKLDVLTGEPEVKLCVTYDIGGRRVERFPCDHQALAAATPIYETMPGWNESIESVRSFAKLPPAARNFVKRIEELAGVPIRYVGVGRTRDAMIRRGKK
ncbi:MAG: adenylosuccinate synthase [Planctomycetota bacterium]|nr:adenylosuccinate synthase [Planctomycetota bacterium]